MALMALSDPRFMFVVPAMLPCVPLLVHRGAVQVSARSTYLLVFFPVTTVGGGYMYVNWLFMGSPFDFLTRTTSEFRGSFSAIEATPWLCHRGGSFLGSALIVIAMAVVSFPVLVLFIGACRARRDRMRSIGALAWYPSSALRWRPQWSSWRTRCSSWSYSWSRRSRVWCGHSRRGRRRQYWQPCFWWVWLAGGVASGGRRLAPRRFADHAD